MAQCDTQSLMGEASCFNCFGYGDIKLVEAALLCRILKAINPVATCNVNELVAEAQCFMCLSPQQWELVKLQLLCNINSALGGDSGGGGGGLGNPVACGIANPVNPPADPTKCAIYLNTTVNSLWYWNNATASWVALIV